MEKQLIYAGKKVRLEVHHLADDDGGTAKHEVCVHNGAVVILPFLDASTLLLIRNRRWAVGEVLIELPAGTLEKGEDPMNCAGRELLEETGYLAGRLAPLGSFYASPGILSEKMYIFAAYDLEKSTASLEPGEEIELLAVTIDEAIHMIQDARIVDGKTIATILMYDRFHAAQK
jgi:ADP-ribose pyrophosphatase